MELTAQDIYKGLKQGRDVVVPGLVNKLYTYLFSQILPSAAVGAITQVCHVISHYITPQHSTAQQTTADTCVLIVMVTRLTKLLTGCKKTNADNFLQHLNG